MLRDELLEAIREIPAIDAHSHLARDRMTAPDAGALMFYHMLAYCLRSAGLPDEKLWPGKGGLHDRGRPMGEWFQYWPAIENTGFGWVLKSILRDLYEFEEPLRAESFPRLEAAFAAKTAAPDWARQVLAKANVVRVLSSASGVAPLREGEFDGGVRFTYEKAPTGGTSEFVPWKDRLARMGKHFGGEITTVERMREAVAKFYEPADWSDKHALVAWISSEADFRPADDATLDRLLGDAASGKAVEPEGLRLLEAAVIRAICRAIRGRTPTFQICYGVQFVTQEEKSLHPVARAAPEFASSMAHLIGEFPEIHFNMLNGFEADEPVWCAMAQGYRNFSLACFWWETFYPSVMHRALHRRLDMVPTPRLMAFFSDGYSVDYIYGRMSLVRRVLARVLAEKVEDGFYTRAQAVRIAREMLLETPRRIFLPDEAIEA